MACQPALLELDQHILSKVLAALDPVSLARVTIACRALRTAGSDEALWQEHCERRWTHPHKRMLCGAALRLNGTALRLTGTLGVPVAAYYVALLLPSC